MKQMFDISEKLISEQSDEIYGVNTINWDLSSWKHLSLIGDEEAISLSHTKVHVFSDSVFCLGKMNENPQPKTVWEDKLMWFKSSSEYRALDRIDGEPMEFEWNIFPGFTTLQLCNSPRVPVKNERRARRMYRTDYLHVDVQRHLMGIQRQWTGMRIKGQARFYLCEKIFTRKMVILRTWIRKEMVFYSRIQTTRRMGQSRRTDDDQIQWKRTPNLPIHESTIQRSGKGGGKLSIHFCADGETVETVFRTIISVYQLSIYGAVSDLCEVLLTLLVHPVKIEYHIEAPKEMPPSSNRICSRTRGCSRPSFKRICRKQPKTELKNRMSTTRASRIWQAARALWKLRICNSSRLLWSGVRRCSMLAQLLLTLWGLKFKSGRHPWSTC